MAGARIFICYRREDTHDRAHRLRDSMRARFGDDVFIDLDVPPGVDVRSYITQAVSSCVVLLAVIGPDWLTGIDEREAHRLKSELDYVRLEIATALHNSNTTVVPLLVKNAEMPHKSKLPSEIQRLADLNAHELADGVRWEEDVRRLIAAIEKILHAGRFSGLFGWRGASAAATIVVLVAILNQAGVIGGDENSSTIDRSSTGASITDSPTTEDWARQANEICEEANDDVAAVPDPEALDRASVVRAGREVVDISHRQLRKLQKLTPPKDDGPKVKRLLRTYGQTNEVIEDMAVGLRLSDVAKLQAQLETLKRIARSVDDLSDEVGATTCAEGATLAGITLGPPSASGSRHHPSPPPPAAPVPPSATSRRRNPSIRLRPKPKPTFPRKVPNLAPVPPAPPPAPSPQPPVKPRPTVPPPPPPPTVVTYPEQVESSESAPTFKNYHNASIRGPELAAGQTVEVSCKVHDATIASASPDGYWYRIATSPWLNAYYSPANNFVNGGRHTDPAVKNC